jgi:hypothetical protein
MDDLERVFETLVEVLAKQGTSRLRTPFQISELYQSIIPYRSYKNQLQFDTNQDYEMAVLRLLAGEGGYVTVEPREVQQQLAEEVQAINPNPGFFRDFAAARALLNPDAVRTATSSSGSYAPPPSRVETMPETAARYAPTPRVPSAAAPRQASGDAVRAPLMQSTDSARTASETRTETDPETCPQCSATLPNHRDIKFCPFCGNRLRIAQCARCGSEIEPRWRFCADCGASATDG